jgi:hypothetical protein
VNGWDEIRWATTHAGYDSFELILRSKERLVSPEVVLESIYWAVAIWAQVDEKEVPPFTALAIPPG